MKLRSGGDVEIHIDAPPAAVYEVLSDVTRTGEWSPECRRCAWVDGSVGPVGPVVGARFRGWNRSGPVRWSRLVEVVTASPGEGFAFRTLPDWLNKDSTTWRYHLEPAAGGTLLTHSYEVHAFPRFPISFVMRLFLRHHADMRPQIKASLEGLKAVVERESATPTSDV